MVLVVHQQRRAALAPLDLSRDPSARICPTGTILAVCDLLTEHQAKTRPEGGYECCIANHTKVKQDQAESTVKPRQPTISAPRVGDFQKRSILGAFFFVFASQKNGPDGCGEGSCNQFRARSLA
jgi:hypothetical protein